MDNNRSGNKGNPSNYKHSPEVIEKIRQASLGRQSALKGKTYQEFYGLDKAEEILLKKSIALQGKTRLEILGTQELVDIRNARHAVSMRATWEAYWKENYPEIRYTQYNEWRAAVLIRDNYTCQHCGITQEELPEKPKNPVDSYLHAHHIKSWKAFPCFRYVIENGLTLCPPCHRIEETRLANERHGIFTGFPPDSSNSTDCVFGISN